MKYALPRVDGGVEIMEILQANGKPEEMIAKWHPKRRAEITGEIVPIDDADIPKDRSQRAAWGLSGRKVVVKPERMKKPE